MMLTVAQAKALAHALAEAAHAAQEQGKDTVDLQGHLQAKDDAARQELVNAIDAFTTK